MGVALFATAVAIVLVIAAVAIGRESARLRALPPRPVFDLDDAVDFVAEHLPFGVAAVLSHDDVRHVLQWHLEYLRTAGAVPTNGDGAAAPGVPVVVGGTEAVEFVLARADAFGLELDAAQAHAVLDAELAYLAEIGAVGPEADPGELGG